MDNVVELFSGTGSFSKVAVKHNYTAHTYDNCPQANDFGHHHNVDILHDEIVLPDNVAYVWASPPCETFSIASVSHHWRIINGKRVPISGRAVIGLALLEKTIELIAKMKAPFWMENPRGCMRKLIDQEKYFEKYGIKDVTRDTIMYCRYGAKSMKPTDIWHSTGWTPRPKCKNYRYDKEGNIIDRHCHHEVARRGARTGIQGIKSYREKSRIPSQLFDDIFKYIKENDE